MPTILEITDGTTTVNLLNIGTGFHLTDWTPRIVGLKSGGIYQDSDIAPGRQLAFGVHGTANEVFNLNVSGQRQNELIKQTQDLLRMLEKARNYWLTRWQDTPVYLKAQSSCETNIRYALIHNYQFDHLDNPYAQPFFTASDIVAMDGLSLGIERGHWLGSVPGTGECALSSSVEEWEYLATWTVVTTAPVDDVFSLLQTVTGRILAGEDQLWKSDDNGDTWALVGTLTPVSAILALLQTVTGRILASDFGQIWKSDDNGDTWVVATTAPVSGVNCLLQTVTGRILAGEDGQIWKSDDNGDTWAVAATVPVSPVFSLLQTTAGRILAGELYQLWRSDDNGDTWALATTFSAQVTSLLQTVTGRILAGVTSNQIWKSDNDGETWAASTTNSPFSLLQTNMARILAGENGQIARSDDDGDTWVVATTSPVNDVNSLLQTVTGRILAGENGQIWKQEYTTTDMGASNTCIDSFVSNKQNIANLTHIYVDDGGVFSSNLIPMSAFPITLLPAVPAIGDNLYLGIQTSTENSGPFSGLVFDLSSIIIYTTSYTITWQYWNGAWTTLTVRDNTNPGTGVFRVPGVSSVHWSIPSDWVANAINGVTAFWVRASLTALAGTITPPTQQNRNIYATVLPYIELDSTDVLGDISAIAQIKATNRSDLDGPAGSAPNLWSNRLLVGLRSYDRGESFQAYLNISDEQNPFGITISVGTNTTLGDDVQTPTGRRATYAPAGVEAMATRATITFGPTIARDFYGTYHAFLRARRTAGVSTDLTLRLQIASGSGGISKTTDTVQLQTTTAWELLDFGHIQIPAAGNLRFTELGDSTVINIQASAASGTPDLYLYDLILIPTDEWSVDAVDKANESDSDIGRSNSIQKLLDIDSITNPKYPVRSLVREAGSEFVTSIYNPITPGEAILQANTQQRLWFLAAQTSATGASYSWISPFEIAHSIQIYKSERYLGLRGDR